MNQPTQQPQPITLTNELGKGGEATVYNVARQPDMVAKLYHQPTPERAAKLRAMLLNPPEQPRTHTAFAWPTALLYRQDDRLHAVTAPDGNDSTGHVVGFLMPKISERQAIFHIYNPAMRRQLPYSVDLKFRYRTATNLAVVVSALHARGYVIGDINESNILVNRQALVTLVDCDSFQVTDESGYIHRCNVGKPEFTPPELQGVSFKTVDQLPEHDLFGLGVLLFQLLMGGYHPFAGVLQSQASVGRVDLYAIREGLFPYGGQSSISPPPAAPQFAWLHPQVQALFKRCFEIGHDRPDLRPSGQQWLTALHLAENALHTCDKAEHIYSSHQASCPLCQHKRPSKRQQFVPNATLAHHLAEGIAAYEDRQPDEVITSLTPLIESGKASADVYAYLAWAYDAQNSYRAIDYAEEALELDPNHALAYYVLGVSQYKDEQYDEAIIDLTQAIHLGYDPAAEVYYQRALVYCDMGDYNLALEDVQQQLRLEEDRQNRQRGLALQKKLKRYKNQPQTAFNQSASVPFQPQPVATSSSNGSLPIAPILKIAWAFGLGFLLLYVFFSLMGQMNRTSVAFRSTPIPFIPTAVPQSAPIRTYSSLSRTNPMTVANITSVTMPITIASAVSATTPITMADMVLIAAGSFSMGEERATVSNDNPVHTVYLDAFQIDPYQVTNAQYRICVVADGCSALPSCDNEDSYNSAGGPDDPVVCVDWEEAVNYCNWASKRLPTEAEWEKASRDRSSVDNADDSKAATSVDSDPTEDNPVELYDMADQISEWVADWYDKNYYRQSVSQNPQGPTTGEYRVHRSENWKMIKEGSSVVYYRNFASPTSRKDDRGFRCARTPSQAEIEALSQ